MLIRDGIYIIAQHFRSNNHSIFLSISLRSMNLMIVNLDEAYYHLWPAVPQSCMCPCLFRFINGE